MTRDSGLDRNASADWRTRYIATFRRWNALVCVLSAGGPELVGTARICGCTKPFDYLSPQVITAGLIEWRWAM